MPEIDVVRHVVRSHQPRKEEDYDPGSDMLIVVHRNPNDPDDPTEFGHHIRLHGLAYRKEMWGLSDFASTVDMELKDLERYYARADEEDYGIHPLATITEHYFEAPPARMKSFAPDYIFERAQARVTTPPSSTEGKVKMVLDAVLDGIEDVKSCLAATEKKAFPCRGMTSLSVDSAAKRGDTMGRMEEQTQRMTLVSSGPLDAVRQILTDRESELDMVRNRFVEHTLLESNVPEIMRKRVVGAAVKRGILEENTWM